MAQSLSQIQTLSVVLTEYSVRADLPAESLPASILFHRPPDAFSMSHVRSESAVESA